MKLWPNLCVNYWIIIYVEAIFSTWKKPHTVTYTIYIHIQSFIWLSIANHINISTSVSLPYYIHSSFRLWCNLLKKLMPWSQASRVFSTSIVTQHNIAQQLGGRLEMESLMEKGRGKCGLRIKLIKKVWNYDYNFNTPFPELLCSVCSTCAWYSIKNRVYVPHLLSRWYRWAYAHACRMSFLNIASSVSFMLYKNASEKHIVCPTNWAFCEEKPYIQVKYHEGVYSQIAWK